MKGRRASGTVPGAGLQQADALNQDECCCLLPLHLPSKQWSQPSPWANLQEFCGSKTDREQGDPAQPCCSPSHVHPCKASLEVLGMLRSLRASVGCSSILPPSLAHRVCSLSMFKTLPHSFWLHHSGSLPWY